MVGPGRPNQGHHHQGRQIRDADIQSGATFTDVAESEPAANERTATATAALPARDAAAAATLHKAGPDSVLPAYLPAGQANSAGPNPSARRDPAKSSDASADAYRSTPGRRLRGITIVPSRRPRYRDPIRTGRVQVIFGGILLSGRAVNVRITPGIGRNCLHELLPTGRPGIG